MATVIDSLLIELGLDSSKFDAAQKKSIEQLRKFDEANQKTQKNLQRSSKESAEGFIKARDALVSFGSAFTAAGFVNFVNNVNSANASLTRNAGMLGVSTKELTGWGNAVYSAGGKAEDLLATVSKLQSLAAARYLGDPTLAVQMSKLGIRSESINPLTGTMNLQKLSEDIKNYEKRYNVTGAQAAANFAPLINTSTFMLLDKGPAQVQKLIDLGIKKAALDAEASQKSLQLDNAERQLGNTFDALKTKIVSDVNPAMMGLVTGLDYIIGKTAKFDDKTSGSIGIFTGYAVAVLGLAGAFKSLSLVLETELAKSLGLGFLTKFIPGMAAVSASVAGVLAMLYSKDAGETPAELEALRKENQNKYNSKNGFSALEKQYGLPAGILGKIMTIESHGNPNAVNPKSGAMGAFQFMPSTAKQYGVTNPFDVNQSATGAAKFLSDLSKHYNGDVDKMLAAYNWGSGNVDKYGMSKLPSESKNYLSQYHAMTGAGIAAPSNTNNSNTTTISMGDINLNGANVTDGHSFMQTLQQSFQTNSLLNYGVVGAR